MNRLRMVAQDRATGVEAARKRALDAAADETLWQGARLTEDQLSRLQDAAEFTGYTVGELEKTVRSQGDCHGEDTERFYPVHNEDPEVYGASRERERAQARSLCGGCGAQAQCLALSFQYRAQALAEEKAGEARRPACFKTTGDHGVWGGLGVRDRKALRRLWAKLYEQQLGEVKDTTTEEPADAAGEPAPSVAPVARARRTDAELLDQLLATAKPDELPSRTQIAFALGVSKTRAARLHTELDALLKAVAS